MEARWSLRKQLCKLTFMTSSYCLLLLLIVIDDHISSIEAIMSQADYPACPVNYDPVYYCCEYGDGQKLLYMKYNRPTGGAYESYYTEGWLKPRQVGLGRSTSTSDRPVFRYDNPGALCRVQQTVQADGTLSKELQCGTASIITDGMGGSIVVNSSLAQDSQDATVFWTTATDDILNNNASFPIGASCNSLMVNGSGNTEVDEDAVAACETPLAVSNCQVKTFTEAPLVIIYVVYALFIFLFLLWIPLRKWLAVFGRSSDGAKPWAGPAAPHLLPMHDTSSFRKYIDRLATPMLPERSTEVEFMHSSVDVVEQTGYEDSKIGKFVFGYLIFVTIGFFPLLIAVTLDSNSAFTPPLFDSANDRIVVYIILWFTTATWIVLIVTYYDKLVNFFRVVMPLERCQFVYMFNPDAREIPMPDASGVSSCIAKLEQLVLPHTRQGFQQTLEVQTTEHGLRFVEFQHLRYFYDDMFGKFVPGYVPFPKTFEQILLDCSDGLQTAEAIHRMDVMGKNTIDVPMSTLAESIAKELFCLFYIYQIMCYLVWFFTTRWQVSLVNVGIICGVITINIIYKRRMLAAVLKMTKIDGGVDAQRDGNWQTIPVSELVTGDLVRVQENWEVPCDLVVLKGNTVCDESALTGESMPVQKFPIPTSCKEEYDPKNQSGKKFTLFAGTKTLSSGHQSGEILAAVHTTGALTVRGQLLQAILYPSLVRFKYDEHLKACIIFLFCFGLVASMIALVFLIHNNGLKNKLFAFSYVISTLSAVLSPLIPVVVTVGQVNATKRLQKRGIFCLNPERIALGGKIRVFAFDKTGTITKEGLDFRGFLPTEFHMSCSDGFGSSSLTMSRKPFSTFLTECTNPNSPDLSAIIKFALASCHSVRYLKDQLVGSDVELKMFRSTKWILIEEEVNDFNGREEIRTIVQSPDGRHALRLIRRFEFDYTRKCMSVIVQDLRTQRRFVFCKGAFEKMHEICQRPTIPNDYLARAERLARDGCYVLGMGFKELSPPHKIDDRWLYRQTRDEVESGLTFVGLLLFLNELKEDSTRVLTALREGNVRTVMITGDNALTACFIARESGMTRPGARMILGEIANTNIRQGSKGLVWKDIDTHEVLSSKDIYRLLDSPFEKESNVELAVTGEAFNYLEKMDELTKVLFHIRIFSRMSPSEKADCIAEMMAAGAITGMCGDGGNDCGALRIAHIGVALSDNEASVVSPFTSHTKSIRSVVDICREGRCSLATSFGNLKFMMVYGLISCGLRLTYYYNGVFISKGAFIFCDGFVLVGLSYALSLAKPLRTLGNERPTSSLIGPTTILSVVGQMLIHYAFLYLQVHLLMAEPWYCPYRPNKDDLGKWWLLSDNYLSTVLFLVVASQYTASGIASGFGARFHQPIYRNYFLIIYSCILITALIYLALGEPSVVTEFFRIATSTNVVGLPQIPLPHSFQQQLVSVMAINMVATLTYELLVVSGPVRALCRRRFHRDRLRVRL